MKFVVLPAAYRQPIERVALALCLLSGAAPSYALDDHAVEDALRGGWGQVKFDLRYRYESVNDELPSLRRQNGEGSTLRLRVGYLTPKFAGLQAFAEYEGNHPVFVDDDFNSLTNRKTALPIIADPEADEVNQLWVSYSGIPDTEVKIGRQRIILDNHRFIGNVGFRQLEQTYDAALITNKSLPATTITGGYIRNALNIFSEDLFQNSGIINIRYQGFTGGKLTAYAYLLDFEDRQTAPPTALIRRNSSQSYGLRWTGDTPLAAGVQALYTLEYAHQAEFGNNPLAYNADYFLAEGGGQYRGFTLKGGIEFLGSDNGRIGFRTPLATLHIFQGYADVFLNTPDQGIVDAFGLIGYTYQPWDLDVKVAYHELSTEAGDLRLGDEINAEVQKNFGKHYYVNLTYARYNADRQARATTFNGVPNARFANDLQRFWVQGGIQF